jgi:hypothetical protein
MPSTFSPLKIELIATGEQSGTWGNTTNTNLGTAIEEAITGSADVAFSSADVTVTLTDTNAAQTARNLRLNLTGTSGGARNLILGSGCQIEKLYLINNGLADAVTVKNTTGTGIAVPAGTSMFVFNNGTNVVAAVTAVTSLTNSSLTSGRIPYATTNGLLADSANLTFDNANVRLGVGTASPAVTTALVGTDAILIPKGNTAARPTGVSGYLRFNTQTNEFEGHNGTAWSSVGGSAISNDTSTASDLFPTFLSATTGTATSIFTSNAKLLYKPSTGEFKASAVVASNGIFVNSQTVATSYTIAAGNSGMSSGPVTVASGQSVTVASGARWVVL